MIEHGVTGNLKDIILQLLQRGDSRHLFLGYWITEDEVAKAHVLLNDVT